MVQFLKKEPILSGMLSYSKLSAFNNSIEISEIVFSFIANILTLNKIQKNMSNWLFYVKKVSVQFTVKQKVAA